MASFLANFTTTLGLGSTPNFSLPSLGDLDGQQLTLRTMASNTTAVLKTVARPQLDLLWHLFIYGFILTFNTPGVVRNYRRRYQKSSNLPLYMHLTVGIAEVLRYYVRAVLSQGPHGEVQPDLVDLVLCYIHTYGTLVLAKDLLKGHPVLSRAVYQSEGLVRMGLSTAAYLGQSPFLHQASIKFTDNFVYTRFGIMFAVRYGYFPRFSAAYAVGSGISPLLAMADTGIPGGLVLFLGVLWGVVGVNRWTAGMVLERYVSLWYAE
jgi:hypothetical protein